MIGEIWPLLLRPSLFLYVWPYIRTSVCTFVFKFGFSCLQDFLHWHYTKKYFGMTKSDPNLSHNTLVFFVWQYDPICFWKPKIGSHFFKLLWKCLKLGPQCRYILVLQNCVTQKIYLNLNINTMSFHIILFSPWYFTSQTNW